MSRGLRKDQRPRPHLFLYNFSIFEAQCLDLLYVQWQLEKPSRNFKGRKTLWSGTRLAVVYMLPYSSTTWWGFFWAWEKLVIDLKNIQMTPFFRLTEDYCIIFEHGDYFSTLIDDFQRPNHSINWFWLCVYLAFIQRFVECCRYKDAFFCQQAKYRNCITSTLEKYVPYKVLFCH